MITIKKFISYSLLLLVFNFHASAQNTNTGTGAGNSGNYNSSYGYYAGDLVTGSYNSFFGAYSGKSATSGGNNTFSGYYSGYKATTGSNNVLMGYFTGYNLTTGSGNVFLGYQAGYSETGSDKLYIDNSSTTIPLIYGDFNLNRVGINALPGTYTLNVGGSLNASSLFVNGVAVSGGGWTTSGANINFNQAGVVSIGTAVSPIGYKLAIAGKMVAEEVVVKLQANWPDYVFEENYELPSLQEIEEFIKENKHLPGIPSTKEVEVDGVSLGEMNALLLEKIEELTLILINMNKELNLLKGKSKIEEK